MLSVGARPRLVGSTLTNPRLRNAKETHVGINQAAVGLLEAHAGNVGTKIPKAL